jgi:ATP-binding cassette subfamily F protein uup
MREALDEDATLIDTISPGSEWIETGAGRQHVLSYLDAFLFPPQRAQAPVQDAVGRRAQPPAARAPVRAAGEPAGAGRADQRPRHRIARAPRGDAAGVRGTLLLVSHDRRFLDNVVTQTLVAEGDGTGANTSAATATGCAAPRRRRDRAWRAAPRRSATPPRAPRTRLSSWEQRELEALPAQIEALEREQHALTERMCAPDYHRAGVRRSQGRPPARGEIEHLLAAKFERWGELDART